MEDVANSVVELNILSRIKEFACNGNPMLL